MTSFTGFRRWSLCVAAALCMTTGLWGCAKIPRHYVRMAEPDTTLTALTANPEKYREKVVMLGGTLIEEEESDQYLWLRLRNRPLDHDFVPHRPIDMGSPEGGQFWVMVEKRQFPREYRQWARMTVVGRVTGTQRVETEPVLLLLYVRGWGTSKARDGVWENAADPSVPAGLGGGYRGRAP